MKQLFLGRNVLAIKEVCQPLLDDHSVLVAVAYSFLSSGTGLAKVVNDHEQSLINRIPGKVKKIAELISTRNLKGARLFSDSQPGRHNYNLGHSCSGVIIAVGAKVRALRVGDLVACAGTNFANHSDIICLPQHLVIKVPKALDLKAASLTGVGAIALHAVERASVGIGQKIAVFGLETLGLFVMRILQSVGCTALGIDHDSLLLLKNQENGIAGVYNLAQDNVVQIIDATTDYIGVDCAIVTADFRLQTYLPEIMRCVRRGGRIVIASNRTVDLPVELACQKGIDLCFVTSDEFGSYCPITGFHSQEQESMATFINLLASRQLNLSTLLEQTYGLNELPVAVEQVQLREKLGVIIDYQQDEAAKQIVNNEPKVRGAFLANWHDHDSIKIGILGGNSCPTISIVSALSHLDGTTINTVVEPDLNRSAQLRQQYRGAKVVNGNLATFQADDSNVIFIHKDLEVDVDQLVVLLDQGKAVFVERDFLDSTEKLERLEKYLQANPAALFCIGRHLRYSPFAQKIKKQLDRRNAPFLLNYRVNLGVVSKEQRFVGSWRFGGVMSHAAPILDLFAFLAGSKPLSVSVDSIRAPGGAAFATDNFIVTVSFADGSVCNLSFTTLGSAEAGRERLELFFDAKTIVMNDYKNLTGYGVAPYFDEKDREPDLGIELMLQEFMSCARRNANLLPLEELLVSAKIILTVDQMVY